MRLFLSSFFALAILAHATLAAAASADQPKPADAKTAVPVRAVVLYSSGVGYFQHAGTVSGDASTELRFKTDQINDIIKSLILEDKKGTVSSVTYPSQDPLEKTLKSFQVDISGNPSLDQLLNQLRGATVAARLPGQADITGVIVGVEQRVKPAGDNKTINVPVLNILADGSIKSIELPSVSEIHLEDVNLQQELNKALGAVAVARDQDKKPVTIHFKGEGERMVLLGYVVEAPVWKSSYRLVLPDVHSPTTRPSDTPGSGKAALQGWAIVENQTDNDWTNVELTLVSGRPISFIENLYQPLYIPRPTVVPELFASLRPPMYDAARKMAKQGLAMARTPAAPADMPMAGAITLGGGEDGAEAEAGRMAMDPTASIASVASAARLGELFEYTVGSVTLPRQSGAMIPIITDPIDVQRVSIYNRSVMPRNPLTGARVTNTTGKHLLTGPITVLEGSHYAGDAQIDNLPPGQDRLISYGVDLEMLVTAKDSNTGNDILTGKIVKGVLQITHKYVIKTEYDVDNKSDHDKMLIIEQPIRDGWDLVDPAKPAEKTDKLYRFEHLIAPGKPATLAVQEQRVADEVFALVGCDADQIIALTHGGPIPKDVVDALTKAADMKRAVVDTERQIAENQQAEAAIVTDQGRINQTLKTVSDKTQLYDRLLKKLNDQETQLEDLRSQREKLTKTRTEQQKTLEDYLANLDVGKN